MIQARGCGETDEGIYSEQAKIAREIRDTFGMKLVFKAMTEGPEVLERAFDAAGNKGKFEELSQMADEIMEVDQEMIYQDHFIFGAEVSPVTLPSYEANCEKCCRTIIYYCFISITPVLCSFSP